MQNVTLMPIIIQTAVLRYEWAYYFAIPIYAVERIYLFARDVLIRFFIDWHRRVDPVWAIEMTSATCALVMCAWMLFGKRGTSGNAMHYSIPPLVWFIAIVSLSFYQYRAAIWGDRKHRGIGCMAACGFWTFITIIIWLRAGFTFVHAPFIALDLACLAACMAYYVSSNPTENG